MSVTAIIPYKITQEIIAKCTRGQYVEVVLLIGNNEIKHAYLIYYIDYLSISDDDNFKTFQTLSHDKL